MEGGGCCRAGEVHAAVISFFTGALGGRGGSLHVCIKPRLGLLQRKGILVVKNVGTHPASLGHIYDVETAVTLSVSRLVQTKALALSNAFDVLFLCVSHGGAPIELYGLYA